MKPKASRIDVRHTARARSALHAVPRGAKAAPALPAGTLTHTGEIVQIADLEARVAGLIGRDKRVLVAGRRTGDLCRLLAAAGCKVSSTSTASGVGFGRKQPRGLFDAVVLLRLVEHVEDPVGLLQRVGKVMAGDGCLVAAVPNITHGSVRLRLLAGHPPPASFEADAPSAWRCYDGASIRRIVERAGFVVTQFERCQEMFDCDPASFEGSAVPKAVIEGLSNDIDALTAAFVVVAHKSPLTAPVRLDLRVRELAVGREDDRQLLNAMQKRVDGHEARIFGLERQHHDSSSELTQVKQALAARFPLVSEPLRSAYAALMAGSVGPNAVRRSLQRIQYEQLVARIRAVVDASLPAEAVVLVVSKGDARLLDLRGRTGWHFLQTRDGVYAGHHPADSAAAIEALERLRAKGAGYLLFPQTALWWLDHYTAFRDHLNRRYRVVVRDERTCLILALDRTA